MKGDMVGTQPSAAPGTGNRIFLAFLGKSCHHSNTPHHSLANSHVLGTPPEIKYKKSWDFCPLKPGEALVVLPTVSGFWTFSVSLCCFGVSGERIQKANSIFAVGTCRMVFGKGFPSSCSGGFSAELPGQGCGGGYSLTTSLSHSEKGFPHCRNNLGWNLRISSIYKPFLISP